MESTNLPKDDFLKFIDFLNFRNYSTTPSFQKGDYMENDIIFCGKCRTKKTHRIKGTDIIVPVRCKCEQEEIDRLNREEEAELRKVRISRLKEDCYPAFSKYRDASFSNLKDGRKKEILSRYIASFREKSAPAGRGLYLYGEKRIGKTYAASAVINALLEQEYPSLSTSMGRLITEMGKDFGSDYDYIYGISSRYKVILIDDIAKERLTDYTREKMFAICDVFTSCGNCVIWTSNSDVDSLPEISERIRETAYVMEIKDGDFK